MLAVLPVVITVVYRIRERYLPNVEFLLCAIAAIGLLGSCGLLYYDQQGGGSVLIPPTPKLPHVTGKDPREERKLLLAHDTGSGHEPQHYGSIERAHVG